MADLEGEDGVEQRQSHARDLPGVQLAVAGGQPRHHHVGVADRLHLVHVVVLDDGVERRVQVVQQVHHLPSYKRVAKVGLSNWILDTGTNKAWYHEEWNAVVGENKLLLFSWQMG